MTRGRAVQIGTASQLFERPAHTFVGHFIGSPGMNFLPLQHGVSGASVAGFAVQAPADAATLGVRPEYVTLAAPNTAGAVAAVVTQAQDIGSYWLLTTRIGDGGPLIRARLGAEQRAPQVGDNVWLNIQGTHTCFYKDEELLG
jgi:glycerol transport system ATP-binding protein